MLFLVMKKAVNRALYRMYEHVWASVLIAIAALYLLGFWAMTAAGEDEVVAHYAWWFIVTITTVGYGDFSPASATGQVAASIVMLFGIGIIGLVIGKLAELVIDFANRKARGLGIMKHTDHVVIMGYREGGTERLIGELLANNPRESIVLCSKDQTTNPMVNSDIDFVRGELASANVLERANVKAAANVIIHRVNDDQTFFSAYAVRAINPHAHLICHLNEEEHVDKIRLLPADDPSFNQVILPAYDYLMAQEMQDRESSAVFRQLISNLSGETLFRYDIPSGAACQCSYEVLLLALKRHHNAMAMAIRSDELILNPPLDMAIGPGMAIFYTATHRIPDIDFGAIF